jgi:hypothetical protein
MALFSRFLALCLAAWTLLLLYLLVSSNPETVRAKTIAQEGARALLEILRLAMRDMVILMRDIVMLMRDMLVLIPKEAERIAANGPKVIRAVFIQKVWGLCNAISHQALYYLVLVRRLIGRHAKDLNQNLFGVLAKDLLFIQRGFVHLCNTLGNIVKAGKDQVDLGAKPPILAVLLLEMGAAIVISLFSICLLMRLRPARKSATESGLVSKEVLTEITQSLVKARLLLKEVEQLVDRLKEGRVNSEARAEGCYRASAERTSKRKALIVGINYVGQRGQLKGCHNDASTMEQQLRKECTGLMRSISGRSLMMSRPAGGRNQPLAT